MVAHLQKETHVLRSRFQRQFLFETFFFLLQDKILAAVVKWMDGTTFVYLFLTQNKALPVFVTIKSIPDDHNYKAEP